MREMEKVQPMTEEETQEAMRLPGCVTHAAHSALHSEGPHTWLLSCHQFLLIFELMFHRWSLMGQWSVQVRREDAHIMYIGHSLTPPFTFLMLHEHRVWGDPCCLGAQRDSNQGPVGRLYLQQSKRWCWCWQRLEAVLSVQTKSCFWSRRRQRWPKKHEPPKNPILSFLA